MANIAYTDPEKAQFLELAVEIGITRAKRQLGYPNSWGTAKRWCDAAGIEVPIDEIKAQAKAHHDWYQTEDLLVVAQEGILRLHLELQDRTLTPDEHKKLSEAYQKYVNTWLLLQGKANNISESRKTDSMDAGLIDLINAEKARNHMIENDNVTDQYDKEVELDNSDMA